jgi:hypothetical protein
MTSSFFGEIFGELCTYHAPSKTFLPSQSSLLLPEEETESTLRVFYIDTDVDKRLQVGDTVWISFKTKLGDVIKNNQRVEGSGGCSVVSFLWLLLFLSHTLSSSLQLNIAVSATHGREQQPTRGTKMSNLLLVEAVGSWGCWTLERAPSLDISRRTTVCAAPCQRTE